MVPEVAELEELRKELGLSQVELTNLMGIGEPTYQDWLYKDVKPSYESLKKINKFIEENKEKVG